METATTLSREQVISLRKEIQARIATAKAALAATEKELEDLQNKCPHPDEHWNPEHDSNHYHCDDCGSHRTTRR